MSDNWCPEWRKLQDDDLSHTTQYKQQYYDLPEWAQDKMSPAQEMEYLTEAEKQYRLERDKTQEDHLATCHHPSCIEIKNRWIQQSAFEHHKELNLRK